MSEGQSAALGREGEALAAAYYRRAGFSVLARNYRTRMGEIDVIARKGALLVFCEVKTRRSDAFALPCEAVTPAKQQRLVRAAQLYLSHLQGQEVYARFDVVEVLLAPTGAPRLHCIENAFSL